MWHRDIGTVARKGGDAFPLLTGQAGHPCQRCGQISRYEHSPGNKRACSPECLAVVGNDMHHRAWENRHGRSLPKQS